MRTYRKIVEDDNKRSRGSLFSFHITVAAYAEIPLIKKPYSIPTPSPSLLGVRQLSHRNSCERNFTSVAESSSRDLHDILFIYVVFIHESVYRRYPNLLVVRIHKNTSNRCIDLYRELYAHAPSTGLLLASLGS